VVFFSSHAQPHPMKVSTVHRLCESESTKMYHFRAELKNALDKIEMATGWTWFIDENDLLHMKKKAYGSQARHLRKKALRSTA